jgi:hypothetical protein
MKTAEELRLQFPCFVLESAEGTTLGFQHPGAIGLAVFTDASKATEYTNFHQGLSTRQFADKDDFLEYLRLLTGQYDQVTIDPKTNRLGTVTPLGQLVELLETAE